MPGNLFPVTSSSNVGNWTLVTMTGTWVTNTTYVCYRKKVGDTFHYMGKISLTGAPNSSSLILNIPESKIINTTKLQSGSRLGWVITSDTGTVSSRDGSIQSSSSTTVTCCSFRSAFSDYEGIDQVTPFTWGNTDFLTFYFQVPIVGET